MDTSQSGGANLGQNNTIQQMRDAAETIIYNTRDPILAALDGIVAKQQKLEEIIGDREIKSSNSAYAQNKASLLMNEKIENQRDSLTRVDDSIIRVEAKVDQVLKAGTVVYEGIDARVTGLQRGLDRVEQRFERGLRWIAVLAVVSLATAIGTIAVVAVVLL
jgi:hypothetical protein